MVVDPNKRYWKCLNCGQVFVSEPRKVVNLNSATWWSWPFSPCCNASSEYNGDPLVGLRTKYENKSNL